MRNRRVVSRFSSRPILLVTLLLSSLVPQAMLAQSYSGMLTWHNDTARTGQNLQETILTPANINSTKFGKIFSYAVDGQIFGQPLYVSQVAIAGKGTFNVVYVTTENDSVYAFDADGVNSGPLWQDSFINPNKGITPIPCADTGSGTDCPFESVIGITGTPVIDPNSGTMYLVAATKENGKYVQRLHGLDITSGGEKFGGPVVIKASVKGTGAGSVNGVVSFSALHENQRTGLLLLNGVVYMGWASFGDVAPFHGWVLGYSATTLARTAVFNTTRNGSDGGVWGGGAAFSVDPTGHIFLQTGNGTFDVNTGGLDYGDSFLKINPQKLTVADYFTPFNQSDLDTMDLDLGSGAGVVLPKQAGKFPNEIISAGKQGVIYLVNRANMGKFDSQTDHVIQKVQGSTRGYWSSAAYWNNSVYLSGRSDFLSQYSLTKGLISTTPVSQAPTSFLFGSTPTISANGSSNGVVWAIERGIKVKKVLPPAVLHAYNAANVSQELYNSNQAGSRDVPGRAITFSIPTVWNGKVYVGTGTELDVYGLLPQAKLTRP
jgi:hypothetical protein